MVTIIMTAVAITWLLCCGRTGLVLIVGKVVGVGEGDRAGSIVRTEVGVGLVVGFGVCVGCEVLRFGVVGCGVGAD